MKKTTLGAVAWLSLAAASLAQVPVSVVNASPHDRRNEWVTVVCPDSKAPVGFGVVKPFGWPCIVGDRVGARGRFLHIRVSAIDAHQRLEGVVSKPDSDYPLDSTAIAEGSDLVIEGGGERNPVPVIVVDTPAGERRWRAQKLHVLERGLGRFVFHGFGRIDNTKLVANVWFYVYPGQRSIPFELFLVNCDPRTSDTVEAIDELRLETIHGVYPAVDFLRARGGGREKYEDGKCSVTLAEKTWLGHAQGAAFVGRLIFWQKASPSEWSTMIAATDSPLHAMASDWSGEWGPWKKLPELHPLEDVEARGYGHAAAAELFNRFVRDMRNVGTIWSNKLAYFGTNNRPADTGDQGDFGVTSLLAALGPKGGDPAHLWLLWPSVFRDASRPSFFYMLDGTPAERRTPVLKDWWTWGLTTHYHPGVSPYRWGKVPWGKNPSNTVLTKDFAHTSSNFLGGHAVLTGSYLSRHVCRQEAETMLAFDSGINESRSQRGFGLGQMRAWGRVPLAFTWHYLANGDNEKLKVFADAVIDHPKLGDYLLDRAAAGWEVRTRGPGAKDGRNLKGKYEAWSPWHQGLCIAGLDALSQVYPSDRLDEILFHLCRTHIKWGWWMHKGRWTVGNSLRWMKGGEGLTPQQYADPTQASPHWPGTAFDLWCHAAVRAAIRRLAEKEPDLSVKAKKIDAALVAQWKGWRPSRGYPGFDRGSLWFSAVK